MERIKEVFRNFNFNNNSPIYEISFNFVPTSNNERKKNKDHV
jgi:hypothetical protein